MLDPRNLTQLQAEIKDVIASDKKILDQMRREVRPLRNSIRRINSRSTTAVSFVGTDGGNNQLQFDPFFMQLVRVVDSSNNEYSLEVVTPSTDTTQLSKAQFHPNGHPKTPLGEMMQYLGVRELSELSYTIKNTQGSHVANPNWVQVYRELVEWAVLFKLAREKDYRHIDSVRWAT